MSKRRVTALVLLLLVVGWYLTRDGCKRRPETPEEEIEIRIDEVERAAEAKEMGALKDFVSLDYADGSRRKRPEIEAVLLRWILSQSSIHLLTRIQSIEMDGDRRAEVSVIVAMGSQPIDNPTLLPSLRADIYRFDASLRKERDDVWRVGAAQWKQATVEDFGFEEVAE